MDKYEDRIRHGKTHKDKERGVWSNRFANRDKRVAWQKSSNADNRNFPREACNGKKNRSCVTMKGNIQRDPMGTGAAA